VRVRLCGGVSRADLTDLLNCVWIRRGLLRDGVRRLRGGLLEGRGDDMGARRRRELHPGGRSGCSGWIGRLGGRREVGWTRQSSAGRSGGRNLLRAEFVARNILGGDSRPPCERTGGLGGQRECRRRSRCGDGLWMCRGVGPRLYGLFGRPRRRKYWSSGACSGKSRERIIRRRRSDGHPGKDRPDIDRVDDRGHKK
jgi:hypothetical protein